MSKPQVRFNANAEEWESAILSELIQWNKEEGVSAKELESLKANCGDIRLISTGNFDGTAKGTYAEQICHLAEIVTLPSGGTANIKYHNGKYINSGNLIGKSVNKNNLKFLYYLLIKNNKRIQDCYRGSSIFHPDMKDVNSLNVFSSGKIDEQKQIAAFLTNMDNIIDKKKQELELTKNYKKSMSSKMFPKDSQSVPEIRFKGFEKKWECKKFKKCLLIQRGGSPRPINEYLTTDKNGINWIKIGDVKVGSRYITNTKEKIKPEGQNMSRNVYSGDLILSNSMSFGRPYILKIDGCIHDGWLLVRNEKKLFDIEFLLQIMGSDYMLNQYKALASGGVVNNLNSDLVNSTNILIPEMAEQIKIGNFFKQLDETILNKENEIANLEHLKATLINKMFA